MEGGQQCKRPHEGGWGPDSKLSHRGLRFGEPPSGWKEEGSGRSGGVGVRGEQQREGMLPWLKLHKEGEAWKEEEGVFVLDRRQMGWNLSEQKEYYHQWRKQCLCRAEQRGGQHDPGIIILSWLNTHWWRVSIYCRQVFFLANL